MREHLVKSSPAQPFTVRNLREFYLQHNTSPTKLNAHSIQETCTELKNINNISKCKDINLQNFLGIVNEANQRVDEVKTDDVINEKLLPNSELLPTASSNRIHRKLWTSKVRNSLPIVAGNSAASSPNATERRNFDKELETIADRIVKRLKIEQNDQKIKKFIYPPNFSNKSSPNDSFRSSPEEDGYEEVVRDRHYVYREKMSVQEDVCHEFKGHRSISIHDIPWKCFVESTRNSVSSSICGFLNTGLGGIVYLGVTDQAHVIGIPLTVYQRDHVLCSLRFTLEKYTPPVPHNRYNVCFVPVLKHQKNDTSSVRKPETQQTEAEKAVGATSLCASGIDSRVHEASTAEREQIDMHRRRYPHAMWCSRYCWCDADALARTDHGMDIPLYVVEIRILPWEPHTMAAPDIGARCGDARTCGSAAASAALTEDSNTKRRGRYDKYRRLSGAFRKTSVCGLRETCRGDSNEGTVETRTKDVSDSSVLKIGRDVLHKRRNLNRLDKNFLQYQNNCRKGDCFLDSKKNAHNSNFSLLLNASAYSNVGDRSLTKFTIPSSFQAELKRNITLRFFGIKDLSVCSASAIDESLHESYCEPRSVNKDCLKDVNCERKSCPRITSSSSVKKPSCPKLNENQNDPREDHSSFVHNYIDRNKNYAELLNQNLSASRAARDEFSSVMCRDSSCEDLPCFAPFPPLYVDEVGLCYFRQSSGLLKLTLDDVRGLIQHRVSEHYALLAQRLSSHVLYLREKLRRLRTELQGGAHEAVSSEPESKLN